MPTSKADPSPNATPAPILLEGTQEIKKFNRPTADEVQILLALYRVEDKNVDVVFSVNIPVKTEGGGTGLQERSVAKDAFLAATQSFHIHDFGLFA